MTRTARLAALALFTPLAVASAQKKVVSISGSVFRYHGDTIWMERDSTMRQSIVRGDTVEVTSTMNGAVRTHNLYLVRGDSAWIIRNGLTSPRAISASVPTSLNKMLELELQNTNTFARLDNLPSTSRMVPAASPETPKTYRISPVLRIAQHRDTVAYIRGCENAHTDTTLFLLFARDSVKRISKPERMFGEAMAQGLYSEMRMSLMQEFTKDFQGELPKDMPKTPGGCPH